jgi:hypothetical protein
MELVNLSGLLGKPYNGKLHIDVARPQCFILHSTQIWLHKVLHIFESLLSHQISKS